MQVQAVMVRQVKFCSLDTTLAEAVEMLRAQAVGSLVVMDRARRVAGVITERDICLALGGGNLTVGSKIEAVKLEKPYCCKPDDEIHAVMTVMGAQGLCHLPVVDEVGKLRGILAMSDIVRHAVLVPKNVFDITYEDAMDTLKAHYAVRPGISHAGNERRLNA